MTQPVPHEALEALWKAMMAIAGEMPSEVVARTELTTPYGQAIRLVAVEGFTAVEADYGAVWLVRSHPADGPDEPVFELYTDEGFRVAWRFAGASLARRLAAEALP